MGKRVNKKEIFIKSGIWIIKKLGEIKASIDIFINSEKQKSGKEIWNWCAKKLKNLMQ
jgi:hypothetical protein